MCEFAFMQYGMFWIYVRRIWVSEFCLKSAQNVPFIKILHSVTHKCPVFENFLPLCDPLKPPPCLPPLLPIYPMPLFLSWLYLYICLSLTILLLYYSIPLSLSCLIINHEFLIFRYQTVSHSKQKTGT